MDAQGKRPALNRQVAFVRVPPVAIALSAGLLGGMITLLLLPDSPAQRGSAAVFTIAAIVLLKLIVGALVILKSRSDRQYQIEQDLLQAFLEHIPDNVFFKDRTSRFIRISRAMADYCGLKDPSAAINKADSDIFTSEHADEAYADEQNIIRTGTPLVGIEEKETWPDGRETWVLTTKVPLRDRRGQIIGTMGIAHNITDRKLAEARLRHMALHDALTGLPNRTLLEDRLGQAIAMAHRNRKQVAVLMLDLDRFKNINDSLGHHVGDLVLQAVAARLRSGLRESDIVARLGGDEFVIVLPSVGSRQDVESVAQKVLAGMVEPFLIRGRELRVGLSIGVCEYPVDGENPESLLQCADAALYEAKKKGRGIYCFFTEDLTAATKQRQDLENDLHQALARGQFTLYYQPLVSTDTGCMIGAEALMRWHHPQHGLLPPSQFIPQLEELGLIEEVGRWVLETACRQNVAWQKEGLAPIRVAVNVSAQQFYRGDIVATVDRVLRETGLEPRCLELELTETLTLDDSEATIKIMQDLKRIGVSLSLDDFGTGWSSLSYLRRFPLDRIKIDRSFLREIETEPAAEAVVRSIITLGRNLGLSCVGEGVETHRQLDYLQKWNCAESQGFLYSAALPAADCAALLRSGTIPLRGDWPAFEKAS
jgi:diguanylate cyclase (GGDEF)-like protein/PAS domain S-box-containing protein